jgi:hypothetical protein
VFLGFIGMIIVYGTRRIEYKQYSNSASRAKADE